MPLPAYPPANTGIINIQQDRALSTALIDLLNAIAAHQPQLTPHLTSGGIIGIKCASGMIIQFNFGPET